MAGYEKADADEVTVAMQEHGDEYTEARVPALDDSLRPRLTFREKWVDPYLNRGNLSNVATFVIMILGIIIVASNPNAPDSVCPKPAMKGMRRFGEYVLAFGLFGFAGGITNWLAITMLFDNICNLPGSGVIPKRFKEIRETVKNVIMRTFFDQEFLEKYVKRKTGQIASSINIEEKIKEMLESPAVDTIIDQKLADLGTRPEGMWLSMMGINAISLKPMIKPFVLGMGSDIAPLLMQTFDPSKIMSIDRLREEIDQLMVMKLNELTPDRVKQLMEDVIRNHLGWLIVWGNIFGGVIGVIARIAGY